MKYRVLENPSPLAEKRACNYSAKVLLSLCHKGENWSLRVRYDLFGNAACKHVRKARPAVSGHGNEISVDTVSEINNTFLFRQVIKNIDGEVFQLQLFRKILHVFLHNYVALEITGSVNPHEMNR